MKEGFFVPGGLYVWDVPSISRMISVVAAVPQRELWTRGTAIEVSVDDPFMIIKTQPDGMYRLCEWVLAISSGGQQFWFSHWLGRSDDLGIVKLSGKKK